MCQRKTRSTGFFIRKSTCQEWKKFFKSTETANLLPKHFRGNERHAIRADMEALAIFHWVDSDFQPVGDLATLVHDDALQRDVTSDIHLGQQHRIFDVATFIDVHI